jgi:FlaA1/EpsC-like NDP-sugar epimerase
MFLLAGTSINSEALFICAVVPIFIVLLSSKTYKIFWARVSGDDLYSLSQMLLLSSLLSFTLSLLAHYSNLLNISLKYLIIFSLYFYIMSTVLILFFRISVWYAKYYLFKNAYLAMHSPEESILIYGCGLSSRFLLKKIYVNIHLTPVKIAGFIDDDPNLKKLYVYGHRVLGNLDGIESVYAETPFNKVTITINDLPESNLEKLREFCSRNNVKLTKFQIDEQTVL